MGVQGRPDSLPGTGASGNIVPLWHYAAKVLVVAVRGSGVGVAGFYRVWGSAAVAGI